jgi:hypothetical protein
MPKNDNSAPPAPEGEVVTRAEQAPVAPPPARQLKRYRVTLNEHSLVVEAENENDARAIFNDTRKEWPSPRAAGWKIEEL